MAETLEFALLARLREVLKGAPATEVELRNLTVDADAWGRTLQGQLTACETRLAALGDDPASSLAAIAEELRRVEHLRPQLDELRAQIAELETRARELRTRWLADAPRSF